MLEACLASSGGWADYIDDRLGWKLLIHVYHGNLVCSVCWKHIVNEIQMDIFPYIGVSGYLFNKTFKRHCLLPVVCVYEFATAYLAYYHPRNIAVYTGKPVT